MAKKAKKHGETQKKKNKWIEMNKRREQRGKADIQKGNMLHWRKEHTVSLSLSKKNSKHGNYSEKLGFLKWQ